MKNIEVHLLFPVRGYTICQLGSGFGSGLGYQTQLSLNLQILIIHSIQIKRRYHRSQEISYNILITKIKINNKIIF